MRAVVVTVGDEILLGQVLNTNASYLSAGLFSIGIPVDRMITVPDNEKEILKEFRSAFKNYDVIVVTGGLGPTHDDITKKCISKFFKSGLILNKSVFRQIKEMFKRRKIRMPAINIEQAKIPKISKALPNKAGTAPGILIEKDKKIFCALPGVPAEMKYISENSLYPYLKKKAKGKTKIIKYRTLHTIGIAESALYKKIGDIAKIETKKKGVETKIAFLPANFEVRIRVTVFADSERLANKAIDAAAQKLKAKAGKYIYSYDGSPVEKVVGEMLIKKRLTLSVAESCTGGLIASKMTDIPGISLNFLDSIISYSNEAKIKLLGVKKDTLKKYGAVSKQTALEMAEGARKSPDADIGLSTTGIAGPDGGTKKKPVGLVWIGYSDKQNSFAKDFYFTRDRLRNKEMMSKMALEILRRRLLNFND
jgi:competence/damage-inducible protein CinA-like protein